MTNGMTAMITAIRAAARVTRLVALCQTVV
jgi:hypothetical protein